MTTDWSVELTRWKEVPEDDWRKQDEWLVAGWQLIADGDRRSEKAHKKINQRSFTLAMARGEIASQLIDRLNELCDEDADAAAAIKHGVSLSSKLFAGKDGLISVSLSDHLANALAEKNPAAIRDIAATLVEIAEKMESAIEQWDRWEANIGWGGGMKPKTRGKEAAYTALNFALLHFARFGGWPYRKEVLRFLELNGWNIDNRPSRYIEDAGLAGLLLNSRLE